MKKLVLAVAVLIYFVYMIVMIGVELRTSIISTLQPWQDRQYMLYYYRGEIRC